MGQLEIGLDKFIEKWQKTPKDLNECEKAILINLLISNRSYALTEALNSGSSLCIEDENTETKLSMTLLNSCRCS